MASPINIKPDGTEPSPTLLPRNFSFSSSTSSVSHSPVVHSKLPERPSVITNKMSPHNAIPIDPNEPEPPLILRESLKSIRHSSLSHNTSLSPTPALSASSSKTNSCNITPLMSPATTRIGEAVSPANLAADLEIVAESKRLQDNLKEDDKHLVYLRDTIGLTDWRHIEEAMHQKGYAGRKEDFRVRYFVIKRDVDAKLKLAISNLRSTQRDVDFYLENGICRDRHMSLMAKNKLGSIRDLSDDETEQINNLTATLRASGL